MSSVKFSRRRALTALTSAALLPGLAAETEQKTVWGIAELFEWVFQRRQMTGTDTADCLQAHLDHGLRHIMWHLGRSRLDYHSDLPTSTRYSGDSRPESKLIGEVFAKKCSLRAALRFAEQNGMIIYGRLAMNRHYGEGYGGLLRSDWVAGHPELLEIDRRGKPDPTRVTFGSPEYRAERVGILMEAARLGVHGLCLDFCRQPPLVGYHPLVLNPWLEQGRKDPRQIETSSAEFLSWCRHRCDFVTRMLRDLRAQLGRYEKQAGRKVPILVRITEATLDLNLMEGIDLAAWTVEKLVDEVALDPFVLWDFEYPETAAPYIALCRKAGIKIYGGANTTAARGTRPNGRAFLERIDRNYHEGADGIALYQSDFPIWNPKLKPILGPLFPLLGSSEKVTEALTKARRAQPELDPKARYFGVDNHSKIKELGQTPRGLGTL